MRHNCSRIMAFSPSLSNAIAYSSAVGVTGNEMFVVNAIKYCYSNSKPPKGKVKEEGIFLE